MPELPEVETTVRGIHTHLKGLTITDVWTDYGSLFHAKKENIKNPTFFKQYKKRIRNKKIIGSERRAKHVLIHLEGNITILIHMKMTGHLLYGNYTYKNKMWRATQEGPLQDPFNQFIHLVFSLSNGKHLVLSDMRKFATVTLLDTNTLHNSKQLSALGPEPLSPHFSSKKFYEQLQKKKRGVIKSVLMDQRIVSGIGNIYSDEILWKSDIHPQTKVETLTEKNVELIWKYTREILRKGIDFKGDSMSDYRTLDGTPGSFHHHHNAYRKTGKPCNKKGCTGTIQRMVIGGRSAHFCNVHQKIVL